MRKLIILIVLLFAISPGTSQSFMNESYWEERFDSITMGDPIIIFDEDIMTVEIT